MRASAPMLLGAVAAAIAEPRACPSTCQSDADCPSGCGVCWGVPARCDVCQGVRCNATAPCPTECGCTYSFCELPRPPPATPPPTPPPTPEPSHDVCAVPDSSRISCGEQINETQCTDSVCCWDGTKPSCGIPEKQRYACPYTNDTACIDGGCCWEDKPDRCAVPGSERVTCALTDNQTTCAKANCCWDDYNNWCFQAKAVRCYRQASPRCYAPDGLPAGAVLFKTCGGGPYSCHACGGQPLRRRVGECFNATWTQDPQFWKLLGCSGGQVQLGIYNVSDTTCTGGHKVAVQPLQQCVSLEPTRDSWEWLQCGES